jgi:hypothetical protein
MREVAVLDGVGSCVGTGGENGIVEEVEMAGEEDLSTGASGNCGSAK